jgi:release factor glutamine methyltransferase
MTAVVTRTEPLSFRPIALFEGLELELGPRAAPPGSAILLSAAAGLAAGAHVHDLGCGSGALALALKAQRPDLEVTGCDSDEEAVALARRNSERLGLDVAFSCVETWWQNDERYDLVLANLPYYAQQEREELAAERPLVPLEGLLTPRGDALAVIREVIAAAPQGQLLAFQHRRHQAAAVRDLFAAKFTWLAPAGRPVMTMGHAR